jgi:hypothetical protein
MVMKEYFSKNKEHGKGHQDGDAMTQEAEEVISHTVLPEDAVIIKDTGEWVFYFSGSERSLFITTTAQSSGILGLSIKDLSKIILSVEKLAALNDATAVKSAPSVQKAPLSRGDTAEKSRNRRRCRRFIRRCEAEFILDNMTYRGIAGDFSLGGLFLRTGRPFPPETMIDIILYFADGTSSRLKAKVRRALKTPLGKVMGTPKKELKNGMGVEITERDARYLHFIRSLLS